MRIFILNVSLAVVALGFVVTDAGSKIADAQSQTTSPKLNDAERALVASSRSAIVRTGMSESYFDRHFKLVKVVNQPGDRRIVWNFSVNEYSTNVSDVLGYYTANGKRVDVHSVNTTLQATSEIKRTIPRKTANQIMQRCIGDFVNPSVEYRASPTGFAAIVLTAEAVSKSPPPEQPKQPETPPPPQVQTDVDVIKKKVKKGPPIIVGAVDLQTGKCTKGELLSGPSLPAGRSNRVRLQIEYSLPAGSFFRVFDRLNFPVPRS